MNLAKYSLDNTKVIYFFLAVLLIGGVFSFGKLGKKEDAPFVIKSAVIMTRYPGAEPAEVERLITEPISREIQSMSGVYKIKSESMYGISKITFELLPSLPASLFTEMEMFTTSVCVPKSATFITPSAVTTCVLMRSAQFLISS